ncbi:acetyl/propionyl/methylcrotonyl-CoA carboxylase subunit alpha [Arenibacterium sp. CAU 1754]
MSEFTSLLVANRGEIALRIMKTARDMGMRCIAVYTDADAGAPHVAFADEAINIGPGPVSDSYLCADRILEAAQASGAQAIHPGYGFLSEDASFARACGAAGLVFVGPLPVAIDVMGNKAAAKRLMIKAGVPVIPGYEDPDQSDATLIAAADKIGYPVMIKAAAGGGGRGMRLVHRAQEFPGALGLARAEAKSAFGSDEIILEKALTNARHIEVQIFADRQGTTVHLGERDCSLQRRHQKVIEECPAPGVSPDLRDRIGAAAVNAARAIGYEGAGTVEFLMSGNGDFHFLEMNTRLQVEHPVTELVTGRDLVALQLAVAQGAPLGFAQSDVSLNGHAIEARIYAEDPANGFLPDTGTIARWQPPQGDGVRVDAGVVQGMAVSPFYDPMLAKIIAHGADRGQARRRLIAALEDTILLGVTQNRVFLRALLTHATFARGEATTGFIDDTLGDDFAAQEAVPPEDLALAAALIYRAQQARHVAQAKHIPAPLLGWSSAGGLSRPMLVRHTGQDLHVTVHDRAAAGLVVGWEGHEFEVSGSVPDLRINGRRIDLRGHHFDGRNIHIATATRTFLVGLVGASAKRDERTGEGRITAPMHGQLLSVDVAVGDAVTPGTRLAVLEAMKLQHEITADVSGTIRAIPVASGTQVRLGEVLVEIDTESAG